MSKMESEVIALAYSFRELFPIVDIAAYLSEAVVMSMVDTTMKISIHEDNYDVLVLAETLQPHFTPRRKNYAKKTIFFCGGIVKRIIKLFKIYTVKQLGYFSLRDYHARPCIYKRSLWVGNCFLLGFLICI